ncbi:MAG: hypothetical protein ACM3X3_01890 [Betaproteobacteria bacterium]
MRWPLIATACILGVIALFLVLVMLPVKVSVRFVRTRGRSLIRVRVSFLSGLIWIPVYGRASRPEYGNDGKDAVTTRDGASVLAEWASRVQALLRSAGEPGNGEGLPGNGRGAERAAWFRRSGASSGKGPRKARRWREVRRRVGRFLYLALKSEGLDVQKLRIRLELGSGEAATSAIGVGLAYAVINTALAAFPVPLRFPRGRPEVSVIPRYDRAALDASVDCIVALTPGYIILRGIQTERRRRRASCPTTR